MQEGITTRATDWHDFDAAGTAYNTALTASSAKAPTTTKPATDETTGRYVMDLREPIGLFRRAVHLAIGFLAQAAADKDFSYRVWSWTAVRDTWVPRLLLAGTAQSGARVGEENADGVSDDWYLVDTINNVIDNTRAASAQVDRDADGLAELSFDASGAALLEIEITRAGSLTAVTLARPIVRAV